MVLAVLVLPQVVMAKTGAPVSQNCGDVVDACTGASKETQLLTASELFSISILSKAGCFDGPKQSYIQTEWISIAEILDDATADSGCLTEADTGGFEDTSFDFSESSMSGSFLLEVYSLGIGYFKAVLPGWNERAELPAGSWRLVATRG